MRGVPQAPPHHKERKDKAPHRKYCHFTETTLWKVYTSHKKSNRTRMNTITLTEEEDGNWKARGIRFGKEVITREISPEIALQAFLTHDGK